MEPTRTSNDKRRWFGFGAYMTAVMVLYFAASQELTGLAWRSELHSHLPLIPLVSLFFLVTERQFVFYRLGYAFKAGLPMATAGLLACLFSPVQAGVFSAGDRLALAGVSLWLMAVGGFVAFFGLSATRAALFPLAFLVFAIPLPEALLERIVAFLLWGSGAFVEFFFRVLGVTFLREDSVFHLGRVTIEIAPECSGIRSSLALFITMTLAARLFLSRWWSRAALVLAVLPLAMVKNAIRIVTLTLLAEKVDTRFLTGHWLHHSGGFVFFGITLGIFGLLLLILRWLEDVVQARSSAANVAARQGMG